VDRRADVRDFLTSRRNRLTPADAGVRADGTLRRVSGLRRGEVAELAGISMEYYTRLERGNLSGASDAVLDAVARALRLDEAEHAHLVDLARATQAPVGRTDEPLVSPEVQATLDAFSGGPAFVRNGRLDIVATNLLGRAVYSEMFEDPRRPPNLARFAFLDERAQRFYPDWDRAASDIVAMLRTVAGRHPSDEHLVEMVDELSAESDEFRVRWAAHPVTLHISGRKHFHHPVVGDLHLTYQALNLPGERELSLLLYAPQPGTGTPEALRLLASWAASGGSHAPATGTPGSAHTSTGATAHVPSEPAVPER